MLGKEKLKTLTKIYATKLLELIREHSKVSGYKAIQIKAAKG